MSKRPKSTHRRRRGAIRDTEPPDGQWTLPMRRLLLAVFGLALLVRVVYWLDYRSSPLFGTAAGPDVKEYHNWAVQILGGQWLWPSVPLHGPGYAFYLAGLYAVTGQALPSVRGIQLLLGVAGLILLSTAVGKRFGAIAAVCTAAVWAAHIPLVYYEAELFSEGLICFLNSLVLAVLLRAPRPVHWWQSLVVGTVMGLSIMTHSANLIFALLIIIWLAGDAWRGRRDERRVWLNPIVAAVVAAVVVMPVAVHNSRLAGRFVMVQRHDGLNFYIGNNPQADGTPNVRFGPGWDRLIHLPLEEAGVHKESQRRAFYFQRSFQFIRESPTRWLRLLGCKLALALNTREVTASAPIEALRPDITLLQLPQLGFAVLLALGVFGLRRDETLLGPVGALVLACLFTQTVFVAAGRYRVPMLPAMFVLAGLGLQRVLEAWQSQDRRALGIMAVVVVLAIAFALLPVVPANNEYPAEAALARAVAYQTKDNWPAAVEELSAAVEQSPDHVPSQIKLGEALDHVGRGDEALLHYQQAVAVEPNYPWALSSLGSALAERGETGAAVSCFQRALATNPEDGYSRRQLAELFAAEERWDQSAEHYQHCVSRHPDEVPARLDFVDVLSRLRRTAESVKQLQIGIRRAPDNVELRLRLARLLAASSDDTVRNSTEALAHARRAAKLVGIESVMRQVRRRDPQIDPIAARMLDVLAMAYAANGSYDLATKTAAVAIAAAELSEQSSLKREIAKRLTAYQQKLPHQDPANTAAER